MTKLERLCKPAWRLGDRRIASIVPTYQQRHIHHLTTFHHVTVQYCHAHHLAWALASERRIAIPEVVDDISYCAAMHELGHILEPTQRFITDIAYWDQTPNREHNEIEAWRWAQEHALWWTPTMDATMIYALCTYGIDATAVNV